MYRKYLPTENQNIKGTLKYKHADIKIDEQLI